MLIIHFGPGSRDENEARSRADDKLPIERKRTRSELMAFLRKKQYPRGRIILGVRWLLSSFGASVNPEPI